MQDFDTQFGPYEISDELGRSPLYTVYLAYERSQDRHVALKIPTERIRGVAELRAQLQGTGISVTRNGNQIILNMPSNITFATDQDQVMSAFYPTLNSVALVLKKFNQTIVDVYGHTDSTGNDQYNYELSERRAMSVANYLYSQGIDGRRFAVQGFGETRPIASNATPDGRAANRRVEIQLSPLS